MGGWGCDGVWEGGGDVMACGRGGCDEMRCDEMRWNGDGDAGVMAWGWV